MVTEGSSTCRLYLRKHKGKTYLTGPVLEIRMCDREALKPASRALNQPIYKAPSKNVECPPHPYPPDGKGRWRIGIAARKTEKQSKTPTTTNRRIPKNGEKH